MFKKLILMALMAAPLSIFAQKFAHFNSNDVLTAYPAAKAVQTELENLGKQYQADLEAMQKELQTKGQKFEAEVNKKTPENMRQRRSQEQIKKMQPIQDAVYKALDAVLKEGGYVYAVDKAMVQGVTINEALSTDITAQVKAKLGIK